MAARTVAGAFAVVAVCTMLPPSSNAQSEGVEMRRQQLEQQLSNIQQQIRQRQQLLNKMQQQRVSLERDLSILNAEIEKAQLNIRAREIAIQDLNQDIAGKEEKISNLNEKLKREKESLAQLLRKTQEMDDYSLVEVVLSNEDLSEFFEEVNSFSAIQEQLQQSFKDIAQTKESTRNEKEVLQEKRAEQVELKRIQQLEKQKIEDKKAEKQEILNITRGQEDKYQDFIQQKRKTASEIRSELFSLRGSDSIPFEKALRLAREASEETGVRPALILGVIAEESNLGENVGTGNWREDMHPSRDQPVFKRITERLGVDPDEMPVSAKPWYGWGGAMGPAQFIPSTWVQYEDRVAEKTGNNPPNPWNPEDAFMASAILLADNGATKGTYEAERLAALRYFAGWQNAEKPEYSFYGDEVMELAQKYQRQIDILAQSE
jgi:membrane-bound lytic murein transglycosylase B